MPDKNTFEQKTAKVKGLFTKLAFANFKNQRRLCIPYLLACTGTAAMFYMMCFLVTNRGLMQMRGADSLRAVLTFGCIVIAIFSAVIVLYANSFIMKQRKRELGLYNILGMEKKHIARLMATETLYMAAGSIIAGLALGVLFSKLLLLLICSMLNFEIPFGFEVSFWGLGATLALFGVIFLIALVWNVSRVGFAKPVELLSSASVGEREPKTKWITLVAGILTLGGGYAIAVFTKNPGMAVALFFVAVILVIIGTYCLFTSASVALLKGLRKNKGYYYKTRHFISVSSMIYRMKQNAVGLGNICILSTMVLVMLSTTICLYYGVEDTLRTMYPKNLEVKISFSTEQITADIDRIITDTVNTSGVETEADLSYSYMELWCAQSGPQFSESTVPNEPMTLTVFIPLEDYCRITGINTQLEEGEALCCSTREGYPYTSATFGDITYRIVDTEGEPPFDASYIDYNNTVFYFIVPGIEDINVCREALMPAPEGEESERAGRYSFYRGMDIVNSEEEQTLAELISEAIGKYAETFDEHTGFYYNIPYVGQARDGYYSSFGGLFFLGMFLALMFTCAAALIMYYKQISEGYDDRGRFEIMRKVGLPTAEVKRSVRSQVLTVFFLPLIAAGIHVAFAFPLISVLFRVLALTNVSLFLRCTLGCYGAFALLYTVVYLLTARTYYKIVAETK